MIVVDHVCTYFALLRAMQPNSKIEIKIPIHIEITLKRNFTFDQLIDKNVLSHARRALPRLVRQSTRGHGLGNLGCSLFTVVLTFFFTKQFVPQKQ